MSKITESQKFCEIRRGWLILFLTSLFVGLCAGLVETALIFSDTNRAQILNKIWPTTRVQRLMCSAAASIQGSAPSSVWVMRPMRGTRCVPALCSRRRNSSRRCHSIRGRPTRQHWPRSGPSAVLGSARPSAKAQHCAAGADDRQGQEAWLSGE